MDNTATQQKRPSENRHVLLTDCDSGSDLSCDETDTSDVWSVLVER